MKKALFLLLSLLLLLPLTGCGLPEGVVTLEEAYYDGVQPGTTTVDALLELWGEPDRKDEREGMLLYSYDRKGCICTASAEDPEGPIWGLSISGQTGEEITRGVAPGAALADILAQLPEAPRAKVLAGLRQAVEANGGAVRPIYGNMSRLRDFCYLAEYRDGAELHFMIDEWLVMDVDFDEADRVRDISFSAIMTRLPQ